MAQRPHQAQRQHHFTRWLEPPAGDAAALLSRALPGVPAAQAGQAIDAMAPKDLRGVFAVIFGSPTTSNNTAWVRTKLKAALGVAGKKRSGGGGSGRKRRHAPEAFSSSSDDDTPPPRAARPRVATPPQASRAPAPPSASADGSGAAGWHAAADDSPRGSPRGSLPSSQWGSTDHFSLYDDSAAVDGAATLLAAAAEVESRCAVSAAGSAAVAPRRQVLPLLVPSSLAASALASFPAAPAAAGAPASRAGAPAVPEAASAPSSLLAHQQESDARRSMQVLAFLQAFTGGAVHRAA